MSVLVVGAGVSGRGFAQFLKSQGHTPLIYDDKTNKFSIKNLEKFDAIYFSPGINIRHPLWQMSLASNITILNDLDSFFVWKSHAKIIGITGTAGKTTICCMISHILTVCKVEHHLCGNMGIDIFKDSPIYIIELSSLVLSRTQKFACDIGIIVNLDVDHLDVHKCKEKYISAKLDILRPYLAKKQKFYVDSKYDSMVSNYLEIVTTPLPPNILGEHNRHNARLALSIGRELGLQEKEMYDALGTFNMANYSFGQFRQTEYILSPTLTFVNDSISTRVAALRAAMERYDNITLIVGGILKFITPTNTLNAADVAFILNNLKHVLPKVRKVYIFGSHAARFEQIFKQVKDCTVFQDMEELIAHLHETVKEGVILFSPMGSSFDFYTSASDRGRHVEFLVNKYWFNSHVS